MAGGRRASADWKLLPGAYGRDAILAQRRRRDRQPRESGSTLERSASCWPLVAFWRGSKQNLRPTQARLWSREPCGGRSLWRPRVAPGRHAGSRRPEVDRRIAQQIRCRGGSFECQYIAGNSVDCRSSCSSSSSSSSGMSSSRNCGSGGRRNDGGHRYGDRSSEKRSRNERNTVDGAANLPAFDPFSVTPTPPLVPVVCRLRLKVPRRDNHRHHYYHQEKEQQQQQLLLLLQKQHLYYRKSQEQNLYRQPQELACRQHERTLQQLPRPQLPRQNQQQQRQSGRRCLSQRLSCSSRKQQATPPPVLWLAWLWLMAVGTAASVAAAATSATPPVTPVEYVTDAVARVVRAPPLTPAVATAATLAPLTSLQTSATASAVVDDVVSPQSDTSLLHHVSATTPRLSALYSAESNRSAEPRLQADSSASLTAQISPSHDRHPAPRPRRPSPASGPAVGPRASAATTAGGKASFQTERIVDVDDIVTSPVKPPHGETSTVAVDEPNVLVAAVTADPEPETDRNKPAKLPVRAVEFAARGHSASIKKQIGYIGDPVSRSYGNSSDKSHAFSIVPTADARKGIERSGSPSQRRHYDEPTTAATAASVERRHSDDNRSGQAFEDADELGGPRRTTESRVTRSTDAVASGRGSGDSRHDGDSLTTDVTTESAAGAEDLIISDRDNDNISQISTEASSDDLIGAERKRAEEATLWSSIELVVQSPSMPVEMTRSSLSSFREPPASTALRPEALSSSQAPVPTTSVLQQWQPAAAEPIASYPLTPPLVQPISPSPTALPPLPHAQTDVFHHDDGVGHEVDVLIGQAQDLLQLASEAAFTVKHTVPPPPPHLPHLSPEAAPSPRYEAAVSPTRVPHYSLAVTPTATITTASISSSMTAAFRDSGDDIDADVHDNAVADRHQTQEPDGSSHPLSDTRSESDGARDAPTASGAAVAAAPERRNDPFRVGGAQPSDMQNVKLPEKSRNPTIEILTGLIQLLGGDVRRRAAAAVAAAAGNGAAHPQRQSLPPLPAPGGASPQFGFPQPPAQPPPPRFLAPPSRVRPPPPPFDFPAHHHHQLTTSNADLPAYIPPPPPQLAGVASAPSTLQHSGLDFNRQPPPADLSNVRVPTLPLLPHHEQSFGHSLHNQHQQLQPQLQLSQRDPLNLQPPGSGQPAHDGSYPQLAPSQQLMHEGATTFGVGLPVDATQAAPSYYYPSPSDVSDILGVRDENRHSDRISSHSNNGHRFGNGETAFETQTRQFELKTPDLAPTVTVPVDSQSESEADGDNYGEDAISSAVAGGGGESHYDEDDGYIDETANQHDDSPPGVKRAGSDDRLPLDFGEDRKQHAIGAQGSRNTIVFIQDAPLRLRPSATVEDPSPVNGGASFPGSTAVHQQQQVEASRDGGAESNKGTQVPHYSDYNGRKVFNHAASGTSIHKEPNNNNQASVAQAALEPSNDNGLVGGDVAAATTSDSRAATSTPAGWLPVSGSDTSRVNIRYDPLNEPDIITLPPSQPSVFDVTVVGNLNKPGATFHPVDSPSRQPGPEIITAISSTTEERLEPTQINALQPNAARPTATAGPAGGSLGSGGAVSGSHSVTSATSRFAARPNGATWRPSSNVVSSGQRTPPLPTRASSSTMKTATTTSTTTILVSESAADHDIVYGTLSRSTSGVSPLAPPSTRSSATVSPAGATAGVAPAPKGHGIGRPFVVPVDVDPVRPSVHQPHQVNAGASSTTTASSSSSSAVFGSGLSNRPVNNHAAASAGGSSSSGSSTGYGHVKPFSPAVTGGRHAPSAAGGGSAGFRGHQHHHQLQQHSHLQQHSKPLRRPQPTFKSNRSNATLVRIDTCIVGDDSTCDSNLNEWCRTDQGISTCSCRPGYARTQPRGPCLSTISMQVTFKLDKMGDKKLHFNTNYLNPESEEYQILEFETRQALRSLFGKSSFSRVFMDSRVNRFKGAGPKVLVNATLEFEENEITRVPSVKRVVQHEIVNLISRGRSNLGDSRLYVEPLLNSALSVEDVNECKDPDLHDCSPNAVCENTFGAFKCSCKPGYTDKNPATRRAGRVCTGCGPDYCNNRGECSIVDGERSCSCKGKFVGPRCDVDGEVLAVALGASVTAVLIIILTLVCLCLWNRRWKREQAKAEVMSVASMAGYLNKSGSVGYRMSHAAATAAAAAAAAAAANADDRFRWSAHLDGLAANIYVQPDSSPLHSMPRAQSIYATQRNARSHSPAMELENPYGPLGPASASGPVGRPKSRGGGGAGGAMTQFGPASLGSPYEFDPNKQPSLFGSYRNHGGTTRSMQPVFNSHW